MPKYKLRPRADDDIYAEDIWRPESSLMAFDSEPVPTGILDKSGQEYWREPEPIGFQVTKQENN